MSYSFSVVAATKAEAMDLVAKTFDDQVTNQPIHTHDRETVLAASNAFIGVLKQPEGSNSQVIVRVNGFISARTQRGVAHPGPGEKNDLCEVGFQINAYISGL